MAQPLYRIHAVAGMVGISENLLRAWERRYRVVTPKRSPSGYRGYAPDDIELLKRVTKLTREGMSIGDIAPLLPELRREVKSAALDVPTTVAAGAQVEQWQQGVLAAAAAHDQPRVEALLDQAMAVLPPLQLVDELLMPVQRAVGDSWHEGRLTISQEHLVSHAIRTRLLALLNSAPRLARRHVVCACMPDDEHEIGLLAAALRFRHAGFRVTYLGLNTPLEQLLDTVKRLQPDVVALSAVADPGASVLRKLLARVATSLPSGTRTVVGGHGAELHAAAVEASGAVLAGPDTWPKILR